MSKKHINVIFADDEKLEHARLEEILLDPENKYEFVILNRFYNTKDLKQYLIEEPDPKPDILLLDDDFKGIEKGIDALSKIKQYAPDLKILLLTSCEDEERLDFAYKKYGAEYIPKSYNRVQLSRRISEILNK